MNPETKDTQRRKKNEHKAGFNDKLVSKSKMLLKKGQAN